MLALLPVYSHHIVYLKKSREKTQSDVSDKIESHVQNSHTFEQNEKLLA